VSQQQLEPVDLTYEERAALVALIRGWDRMRPDACSYAAVALRHAESKLVVDKTLPPDMADLKFHADSFALTWPRLGDTPPDSTNHPEGARCSNCGRDMWRDYPCVCGGAK
jgi:hypothetical protein